MFCAQPVFAGVLVLLFITAGSAPLGPHVKPCGNGWEEGEGGADEQPPLKYMAGWGEAWEGDARRPISLYGTWLAGG